MAMEVLVIGAGMVGVSVAWHLRRRGHEVTLIDRREPGSETSYGNAGLIQREAVKPHPFPRHLVELLRILPDQRIDIRYRAGALFDEREALAEYWRDSQGRSFARTVSAYASLIVHCTEDHQVMFKAAGAEDLIKRNGWLRLYRTEGAFEAGVLEAKEALEKYGVTFEALRREEVLKAEPCLSDRVIGAIHWTNSWSVVDPGALVKSYVDAFVAEGGKLIRGEVRSIEQVGKNWRTQLGDSSALDCGTLVLATGPWSSEWLKYLGYHMPMFVQRGYHMHYDAKGNATLGHAIMDSERGYVVAPKRAGLRLTTGAELNTIGAPPRYGQLEAAELAAQEIFPIGKRKEEKPWLGARPCLADMKPVIGPAYGHANLWFAFGHGHQGFTLGPTTGRLLSQLMTGEAPAVDMSPFRSDRFRRERERAGERSALVQG